VEAYAEFRDDAPLVVTLAGELDAAEPDWDSDLQAALAAGQQRIILDLRNVTFIDSSVIRTLVLTLKQLPAGGWLRLVYTHHLIRRVIDICGLADNLPQYTTLEAALRDTPNRSVASHDSPPRATASVHPLGREGGGDD
jgi:stage II sporulation protein AA (anti-sigma F factor antagonist)